MILIAVRFRLRFCIREQLKVGEILLDIETTMLFVLNGIVMVFVVFMLRLRVWTRKWFDDGRSFSHVRAININSMVEQTIRVIVLEICKYKFFMIKWC